MQVILLESIRKLGKLGEVVSVKPGFARNFLIPMGKAAPATETNKTKFESQRHELELKAKQQFEEAQTKADKLKDLRIVITALASEEGKLYGSVGTTEIKDAIYEKTKLVVERKDVRLPNGPIHTVGESEIAIQLHNDIVANIIVVVEERPH